MNLYVFSLITGMMVLAGFVVAFAGYAVGGLLAWACRPVLPDGDSQIFRTYVFGPSGLSYYGSAMLRCKL